MERRWESNHIRSLGSLRLNQGGFNAYFASSGSKTKTESVKKLRYGHPTRLSSSPSSTTLKPHSRSATSREMANRADRWPVRNFSEYLVGLAKLHAAASRLVQIDRGGSESGVFGALRPPQPISCKKTKGFFKCVCPVRTTCE